MTSTQSFITVQPSSSSSQFPGESLGDVPLVSKKFVELNVSSIDHISIVNKKVIEEDRQMQHRGQMKNIRGMLSEADLKITFSIAHPVQESQLTACVCEHVHPLAKNIDVKIGYLTSMDQPSAQLAVTEPRRFAVVIPLIRGIVGEKPLWDNLNTWVRSAELLHVLVKFYGCSFPSQQKCCWKIRLTIDQFNNQISCTSVTSSSLEAHQVQDSFSHLGCVIMNLPNRLWSYFSTKKQQYLTQQAAQQQPTPTGGQPSYMGSGFTTPSESTFGRGTQQQPQQQQPLYSSQESYQKGPSQQYPSTSSLSQTGQPTTSTGYFPGGF